MTVIYKGGCAVMLEVDLYQAMGDNGCYSRFGEVVKRLSHGGWSVQEENHLTLQFVGRDLDARRVVAVVTAAFESSDRLCAPELVGRGGVEVFRTKAANLVTLVEPSDVLVEWRNRLRFYLSDAGVNLKDDFEYRPHVTLAEHADRSARAPLVDVPPWRYRPTHLVVKYGPERMRIQLRQPSEVP